MMKLGMRLAAAAIATSLAGSAAATQPLEEQEGYITEPEAIETGVPLNDKFCIGGLAAVFMDLSNAKRGDGDKIRKLEQVDGRTEALRACPQYQVRQRKLGRL